MVNGERHLVYTSEKRTILNYSMEGSTKKKKNIAGISYIVVKFR